MSHEPSSEWRKILEILAKHLQPSMLFLLVIIIVANLLARDWLAEIEHRPSSILAFWLWWVVTLGAVVNAINGYRKDTSIKSVKQLSKDVKAPSAS